MKICGLRNCIAVLEDKFNVIRIIKYNILNNTIDDGDRIRRDTYLVDFKSQKDFETIIIRSISQIPGIYDKFKEVYDKCQRVNK